MERIPFSIIGEHIMQIPLKVNGKEVKFLLDTGIGPTVISKDFAKELDLKSAGTMTGKRMSGQELNIPLVKVPLIEAGSLARENLEAGIFDTSGFPDILKDIKGILSIGFFKGKLLTIDYLHSLLLVAESDFIDGSVGEATKVPMQIEYNGPSVTLYVNMKLPNGRVVKFEVDTGSNVLIVNSKLMGELAVDPKDKSVESVKGYDETGNYYERFFTEIKGKISVDGNPDISQENPKAIFQDIIHDGLVGHDFLKRYIVSFDIDKEEMRFYRHSN